MVGRCLLLRLCCQFSDEGIDLLDLAADWVGHVYPQGGEDVVVLVSILTLECEFCGDTRGIDDAQELRGLSQLRNQSNAGVCETRFRRSAFERSRGGRLPGQRLRTFGAVWVTD